jgi:hypothetical protein
MRIVLATLTLLALAACDGPSSEPSSTTTAMPPQTATTKELELTLTSVEETRDINAAGLIPPPEEGQTYIVAHYTLTNTGKKPIGFIDRPPLDLVDATGQVYDQDVATTAFFSSQADPGYASSTNPGTSTKMAASWKVAEKDLDLATWALIARTTPEHRFKLQ